MSWGYFKMWSTASIKMLIGKCMAGTCAVVATMDNIAPLVNSLTRGRIYLASDGTHA